MKLDKHEKNTKENFTSISIMGRILITFFGHAVCRNWRSVTGFRQAFMFLRIIHREPAHPFLATWPRRGVVPLIELLCASGGSRTLRCSPVRRRAANTGSLGQKGQWPST